MNKNKDLSKPIISTQYKGRVWEVFKSNRTHLWYKNKDGTRYAYNWLKYEGKIKKLVSTEDFLLVYTDHTIWVITGEPGDNAEMGTLRQFRFDEMLFVDIINTIQVRREK